MGEELVRRWDDAVETAWREYRQRIADRLAEIEEETIFGIATWQEPGVVGGQIVPLCHVTVDGDLLRLRVNSNAHLPDDRQMVYEQTLALMSLGFEIPMPTLPDGETYFWADLPQRQADLAAVMLVQAVRAVHGLPHPVYLETMGLEEDHGRRAELAKQEAADLSQPIFPRGTDELRRGIEMAVSGQLDGVPDWDEDGDLPLPTTHGTLWLFISPVRPRILLHCSLAHDVVDLTRALVEVNELNAREVGLTFSLSERSISVCREIDVTVLVPAVVEQEVDRLLTQVDGWANELVARLGGKRMEEGTAHPAPGAPGVDGPGRFETAYAVLCELEKQERGSVGPATMLRIFHQDRALLLQAINLTEGHSRQDLRRRLRQALRLLVETPRRKVPSDQLALFDEDECDHRP